LAPGVSPASVLLQEVEVSVVLEAVKLSVLLVSVVEHENRVAIDCVHSDAGPGLSPARISLESVDVAVAIRIDLCSAAGSVIEDQSGGSVGQLDWEDGVPGGSPASVRTGKTHVSTTVKSVKLCLATLVEEQEVRLVVGGQEGQDEFVSMFFSIRGEPSPYASHQQRRGDRSHRHRWCQTNSEL